MAGKLLRKENADPAVASPIYKQASLAGHLPSVPFQGMLKNDQNASFVHSAVIVKVHKVSIPWTNSWAIPQFPLFHKLNLHCSSSRCALITFPEIN